MPAAPANTAPAEPLLRPFMPELDTIRGIAVLGVMLLHAFYWQYSGLSFGPWPRRFLAATQPGWMGVNLFFVLSGFLITGILLDSKNKPHYYRRFYTRRALRILPAYYSLLIVLIVLRTSSAAFVGLSFIYLANMTDFFGVVCDYGPLWSLAVEEHFYILWPTVAKNVTARGLALISAAIVVLTPVLRATSFALGHKSGLDWYTWFVADGLALGSLLAIALRSGISRKQVQTLCGILLAFRIYDWTARRYFPTLLPTSGHFNLVLLKFALAGGSAIAIAYLSRKYFEERFLRLKDSLVPKPSAFDPKPGEAPTPQAA